MWFKVVAMLFIVVIAAVLIRAASRDGTVVRLELAESASPADRQEPSGESSDVVERAKELRKQTVEVSKTVEERTLTPPRTIREVLKQGVDAYPLQSMSGRISHPIKSTEKPMELSSDAQKDLVEIEAEPASRRGSMLRSMHLMATRVFADTQGRGIERMAAVSKEAIDDSIRSDEVPVQPESLGTPLAEQSPAPAQKIEDALKTLHRSGIGDFASQQDFGYITDDGKKAAGFIPHRFTKTPPADPRLQLKRIDLVGLLMHPEPVVYRSEKLPRMEELKSAPTRKPDEFETKAIAKLRYGESMVVREEENGTRMVGAIRAAKQCTACTNANAANCLERSLIGSSGLRPL